jgi:hypothetical protein
VRFSGVEVFILVEEAEEDWVREYRRRELFSRAGGDKRGKLEGTKSASGMVRCSLIFR